MKQNVTKIAVFPHRRILNISAIDKIKQKYCRVKYNNLYSKGHCCTIVRDGKIIIITYCTIGALVRF